jgi:hypothetical protein
MLLLRLQDVIEIMHEGMLDCAPLGGMPGGLPMLDFRKAPGSRGGKAGEAARFMAALRAMGSQQGRDVFDSAELQVRPLCRQKFLVGVAAWVVGMRQGRMWVSSAMRGSAELRVGPYQQVAVSAACMLDLAVWLTVSSGTHCFVGSVASRPRGEGGRGLCCSSTLSSVRVWSWAAGAAELSVSHVL